MKFEIIPTKTVLYDKCENVEQLYDNFYFPLLVEFKELKKQLEYLRSGEYLNQLKFENKLLEDIIQFDELSKEDKEFIDMTHRNTELLEENQALKEKIRGKQSSIKALKDALKERTDERDNHYDKERLYKSVIDEIRWHIEELKIIGCERMTFKPVEEILDKAKEGKKE